MSDVEKSPGEQRPDGPPELFQGVKEGDEVRVSVRDDSEEPLTIIGTVDDVRLSLDELSSRAAITIYTDERDIWDLETVHDPRHGWEDIVAAERQYQKRQTEWKEHGTVEAIEQIQSGVSPELIEAGVDYQHVSGDIYRAVVEPIEREYDNKMLAFNLDSSTNTLEKIDPEKVVVYD